MAAVNPTIRRSKAVRVRRKGANVRPELASTLLVESAFLENDEAVANRYGVSTRTIARLRAKATYDENLAKLVQQKQEIANEKWGNRLAPTLDKLFDALESIIEKASSSPDAATNPEIGRMVIGGIKILTEIRMQKQIIDIKVREALGGGELPAYIPDKQLNPAPEDGDYIDVEAE